MERGEPCLLPRTARARSTPSNSEGLGRRCPFFRCTQPVRTRLSRRTVQFAGMHEHAQFTWPATTASTFAAGDLKPRTARLDRLRLPFPATVHDWSPPLKSSRCLLDPLPPHPPRELASMDMCTPTADHEARTSCDQKAAGCVHEILPLGKRTSSSLSCYMSASRHFACYNGLGASLTYRVFPCLGVTQAVQGLPSAPKPGLQYSIFWQAQSSSGAGVSVPEFCRATLGPAYIQALPSGLESLQEDNIAL